jgi:uncharacterized protein (UPF0332 family)
MSEDRERLVVYFLERAEETLHDAKKLSSDKAWNSALNRLYYACFYAVQAALHQKISLDVKTHSGIKTQFNIHFTKEKMISLELSSFYSMLMQRRGESDYAAFEKLNSEDVLPLIPQAEEFIQALKNIIQK